MSPSVLHLTSLLHLSIFPSPSSLLKVWKRKENKERRTASDLLCRFLISPFPLLDLPLLVFRKSRFLSLWTSMERHALSRQQSKEKKKRRRAAVRETSHTRDTYSSPSLPPCKSSDTSHPKNAYKSCTYTLLYLSLCSEHSFCSTSITRLNPCLWLILLAAI